MEGGFEPDFKKLKEIYSDSKSPSKDQKLQAKNDEAIKADEEAVSKSEKSLSQIAIDQNNKLNGESKTIGKWTPELEAEYKKSGFTGSRGDWLKDRSTDKKSPSDFALSRVGKPENTPKINQ